MKVKVMKLVENAVLPLKAHPSDAGADLTVTSVEFDSEHDVYTYHSGIAMEIPEGYEAHIVPRSSTFKNFGIIQANSMGIVDESYCGPNDWFYFPAIALRDTEIHVNDRICQFRIQKHQPKIEFEEVESLGNEARGGFGSTGV